VKEECRPKMISLELWHCETGELVSGEIGYIVGQCYTCTVLFPL
jgi:hypothetical protein